MGRHEVRADEADADPRRALVADAPVGLAWSDGTGAVLWANERWRALLDYDGPLPIPLSRVLRLVHDADRDALAERMRSSTAGEEVRMRLRSGDGRRHLELATSCISEDPDATIRFVGVVHDVTELTRALEDVRRSEELFRSFTSTLPIAVFRTDPAGTITWANAWLEEMSGYSLDAMRDVSAFDLIHPEDREDAYVRALDAMAGEGPYQSEHRFLCRDGSVRWIITRTTPVRDDAGHVVEHVGTMEDVTHLHSRSAVLAHAAAHDDLTGLPNRASALERLEELCARAHGRDDVGVVFVDLDGFKAINDTHGHHVGDAVLVAVADRLRAATRTEDLVARFAGDEFVVVCPEIGSESVLEAVADRIREQIGGTPVRVDGRDVPISASAGLALGPGRSSVADLLRRADQAMYLDKRSG